MFKPKDLVTIKTTNEFDTVPEYVKLKKELGGKQGKILQMLEGDKPGSKSDIWVVDFGKAGIKNVAEDFLIKIKK